jgi:hypothetical protein
MSTIINMAKPKASRTCCPQKVFIYVSPDFLSDADAEDILLRPGPNRPQKVALKRQY